MYYYPEIISGLNERLISIINKPNHRHFSVFIKNSYLFHQTPLLNMKNILVPTDFSQCSANAYNYATMLAEHTGATIHLFYALDISFNSGDSQGTRGDVQFMMQLLKLTKARMNKLRKGSAFKNFKVNEVVVMGSLTEKITEIIRKNKIDMVVMGTHGTSGMQQSFVGSNSEKVVRNADIPVLTVRDAVKNPMIKKIIFATDFSYETKIVLRSICAIAEMFDAELILAKVVTQNDFETTHETELQIEDLRKKSKMFNYSTKIYYAHSREQGIRNMADTLGADIIAVGTHGRHGLARLFQGSVAERVVNHSSLPVLTINFHKKLLAAQKAKNNNR